MDDLMLGVAIENALPVPVALMLFALLCAAFNVILGRHDVIPGVAFLLVTLDTARLALGAACSVLSLIAECVNMSKPDEPEPAVSASKRKRGPMRGEPRAHP
ncbi:hypothetical protein [Burkholderia multivorans]|uniref:Uncharacterized protein n=1 Tax=Burkholderia multivorans TaxID=87883 RepID=A0AB37APU5_9BURK|nr:hypothetical protein [Burkholderia multivorans]MBU9589612.1 hypothetical protein [Burkholderia multivorans]PRE39313.1 hypothetical protein C6P97_31005 [Burkholderia multivorans]PRE42267.1 hypothetical protein C6P99_24600 [Burkholderia multivorans]